jgi:uncharacterized SAM-binding protein YcdF (DUF218 family)
MRRLTLISFFVFCVWFSGFIYYIYYSESYRIDTVTTTDAIVVFTGGKQRINTGIKLLKAGYAPILFISGVASPKQLQNFLVESGVNVSQVIYGLEANTTKDNVLEIVEFISKNNIRSIRLVTSSYHMLRALEETLRLIPSSVIIIPHPVFSETRKYAVLFKEYHKYIASRILEYWR